MSDRGERAWRSWTDAGLTRGECCGFPVRFDERLGVLGAFVVEVPGGEAVVHWQGPTVAIHRGSVEMLTWRAKHRAQDERDNKPAPKCGKIHGSTKGGWLIRTYCAQATGHDGLCDGDDLAVRN